MLRQFFGKAKAHAHAMAEPDQRGGEQAPDHQDHSEAENNGQPFVGRQQFAGEFILGQIKLVGPTGERAVGAGKLFFEVGEGAADQA